eukprot:41183-Amphidinium_carterae.1
MLSSILIVTDLAIGNETSNRRQHPFLQILETGDTFQSACNYADIKLQNAYCSNTGSVYAECTPELMQKLRRRGT